MRRSGSGSRATLGASASARRHSRSYQLSAISYQLSAIRRPRYRHEFTKFNEFAPSYVQGLLCHGCIPVPFHRKEIFPMFAMFGSSELPLSARRGDDDLDDEDDIDDEDDLDDEDLDEDDELDDEDDLEDEDELDDEEDEDLDEDELDDEDDLDDEEDDDLDDELLDLDDEFDDEDEERPRPGHHRYDE